MLLWLAAESNRYRHRNSIVRYERTLSDTTDLWVILITAINQVIFQMRFYLDELVGHGFNQKKQNLET